MPSRETGLERYSDEDLDSMGDLAGRVGRARGFTLAAINQEIGRRIGGEDDKQTGGVPVVETSSTIRPLVVPSADQIVAVRHRRYSRHVFYSARSRS